jgi:hypothetical protein
VEECKLHVRGMLLSTPRFPAATQGVLLLQSAISLIKAGDTTSFPNVRCIHFITLRRF